MTAALPVGRAKSHAAVTFGNIEPGGELGAVLGEQRVGVGAGGWAAAPRCPPHPV